MARQHQDVSVLFVVLTLSILCKFQGKSEQILSKTIFTQDSIYTARISRFPSKIITFRFSILCVSMNTSLDMKIQTRKPSANQKCFQRNYGQFANKDMVMRCFGYTNPAFSGKKKYNCTRISENKERSVHLCSGVKTIQDYKPRSYFLSFSFGCRRLNEYKQLSIGHLQFNISVIYQSNNSRCIFVGLRPQLKDIERDISNHTVSTLPNLVGHDTWDEVAEWLQYVNILRKTSTLHSKRCFLYFTTFFYHLLVPQCNSGKVTHPCKEMCFELFYRCWDILFAPLLKNISLLKTKDHSSSPTKREEIMLKEIDCSYLPSNRDSCFNKPLTCDKPKAVTSAVSTYSSQFNGSFFPGFTVKYECKNGTQIESGNNTVVCLSSGEWSKPPKCSPTTSAPVAITASVFIVALCVFLSTLLIANYKYTQKRTHTIFKRNKTFDAFVSCNFDAHHNYVIETLLPEFEERSDPPFKLCYHERNFTLGHYATRNVQSAIQNSNSAIFLIGKNFLKSGMCVKEYEDSTTENIRDPSFRLFVIMMEPVEDLKNVHKELIDYIQQRTYAKVEDPDKFERIMKYLRMLRGADKEEDPENVKLLL